MNQALTMEQAVALARAQNVSDSALRVLHAAWWLKQNDLPRTVGYLNRRSRERVGAINAAREQFIALNLWPAEKPPKPKHEPKEPKIKPQFRPEYPSFLETTKEPTAAELAARCITDFDKAQRSLKKPVKRRARA